MILSTPDQTQEIFAPGAERAKARSADMGPEDLALGLTCPSLFHIKRISPPRLLPHSAGNGKRGRHADR
jgi:hypothetical protein